MSLTATRNLSRRAGWSACGLIVCALFASPATVLLAQPVDLLLTGNIYTGNDQAPRAEAVAVRGGRIVFVGSTAAAKTYRATAARIIDLGGQTVLPGLTDAHAHLAGIGFRELNFNLEGTTGIADLQARLKARVGQLPPGQWLVGRGWIETHWSPSIFPTRQDLDAAVPDRPVLLRRSDGHAIVVNSLALRVAHLDRTTPNPSGGEILHDEKGEPTGVLVDNAADLILRLVPPPSEKDLTQALVTGADREVKLGWTQVHVPGNSFAESQLMERLIGEGRIKLRISDSISGPGFDADEFFAAGPVIDGANGRFTRNGIKLYMDGALGSRGAALLEPYTDAPQSRGLLVNDPAVLRPLLIRALKQGIQIQIHAIGDRGNRVVLDLYEEAFRAVPAAQRKVPDPRWRIEHAQVLSPSDLPRFAQLGVIPSMQPSHAIGDLYFAPSRLGPDRLKGAYAWRSLLDTGAIIPGGSDAPVERGEPMIEFYAAVARRSLDGFANADWHLEQRVTRAEALKMFTLWPAYAAFQERDRGTIEVGKEADFTVLSADIMTIPEREIPNTRCIMTIIGGEVVYDGTP